MSGGPPHHPHNRQNPATNSAWNHLQVPNFFPRQPLHAHMSTDPAAAALLQQVHVQPTWHVPTTDPLMKVPSSLQTAHHHLFNLEQMVAERQQQQHHVFPRDLSSPRNGSGVQQNGGDMTISAQLPPHTPPISLSVRDTNKINSMPASALEINVKSTSPSLKCLSPGLTPAAMSVVQQSNPKASGKISSMASLTIPTQQTQQQQRLAAKRGVDSILERLNLPSGHLQQPQSQSHNLPDHFTPAFERPATSTVGPLPITGSGPTPVPVSIDSLQASINAVAMGVGLTGNIGVSGSGSGSQHDENSNSSSILLNVPTPTNAREDDVVSPCSNDDNSVDSNKSRRKRKPSKTMRVSKDVLPATIPPPSTTSAGNEPLQKHTTETAVIPTASESQQPVLTKVASVDSSMQLEPPLVTLTPTISPAEIQVSVQPQHNTVDNNIPRPDVPLENKISERRKSLTPPLRKTSRRKASSESETIANIAAMVQEMQPKHDTEIEASNKRTEQPKNSIQCEQVVEAPFGEVENKLEEMFAGLEDASLSIPPTQPSNDATNFSKMGFDNTKDLLKLENNDPLTSNTPGGDTSLRRATRSTPGDVPLDSDNEQSTSTSTPSSSRRRKKDRKSPKRSKSANCNSITTKFSTKAAKKCNKSGISTSISLASSLASKLSSDIKDVVANAYDSGSNASSSKSRGPFIQIKGPRDSPHSVCIVNSSNNADGDDHQGSSGAGGSFGGKAAGKAKFHDDSEYRQRVRVRGLHCSTLSNKYDAQTRDATWICAFCKRGPHAAPSTMAEMEKYPPPGDLFGPYVITTACAEFQRRLDDPYDKQFKSKKVCRSLDAVASTSKVSAVRGGRGSKRKLSESHGTITSPTSGSVVPTDDHFPVTCEQSIMLGITIMPEADNLHTTGRPIGGRTVTNSDRICYEVWAHEDCIVWSAGVHLAGGGARIVGLEAAVWASSGVTCTTCSLRGANVCCMRRGCARAQHYGCARVAGWTLRDQDYAAFCTEHAGLTSRGTPAPLSTPMHNGDTVPLC